MFTPLLWVLFFQGDPIRPFDAHTMVNAAQSRAIDEQRRKSIAEGQRGFEEKFNKLIDALQEFTREYNGSQGQVWPAKKAEALKTALREVERAMPAYKKPAGKASSIASSPGSAIPAKR